MGKNEEKPSRCRIEEKKAKLICIPIKYAACNGSKDIQSGSNNSWYKASFHRVENSSYFLENLNDLTQNFDHFQDYFSSLLFLILKTENSKSMKPRKNIFFKFVVFL